MSGCVAGEVHEVVERPPPPPCGPPGQARLAALPQVRVPAHDGLLTGDDADQPLVRGVVLQTDDAGSLCFGVAGAGKAAGERVDVSYDRQAPDDFAGPEVGVTEQSLGQRNSCNSPSAPHRGERARQPCWMQGDRRATTFIL